MSRIRSRDTKPELFIRSLLHRNNFRFRVSYPISGTPDMFFTKKRIAVFIHGCFWHRHNNCKFSYVPKSNVEFWRKKFRKNILRDKEVITQLKNENIRILILWECTVKKMIRNKIFREEILDKVKNFLCASDNDYLEM